MATNNALSAVLQKMRADGSLDENLDYDSLRARIALELRAYFGEGADERLINSHVDTYFRERFRFTKPNMPLPVQALAMVYLHRKYLLILPVIFVLALGLRFISWESSTGNLEELAQQWSTFKTNSRPSCTGLHYAEAFCNSYVKQISDTIAEGDSLLRDFDGKNLPEFEANITRHMGTVLTTTDKINSIIEADAFHYQLVNSREFTQNSRKYEQLAQAANDVTGALRNQSDPAWALENLKRVQELVVTANEQEKIAGNYFTQLNRLRLPAADMAVVRGYADTALADVSKLNTENAEKNIVELAYLLDLAADSIELQVVKSNHLAKVVTRDEGLQVLTYLIVDARTGDEPINIKVSDVRTGTSALVSQFGIRIPQEVYDSVLTGELEDVVAVKPRGQIQFRYNIPTLNDTITEWQDVSFYGQ